MFSYVSFVLRKILKKRIETVIQMKVPMVPDPTLSNCEIQEFLFFSGRSDFPPSDHVVWVQISRLSMIEGKLRYNNVIKSTIPCLDCARPLEWINTGNFAQQLLKCVHCPMAPNLLRCDTLLPTCGHLKTLKTLMVNENMQLVASALNLVLVSCRYVNTLSPLSEPDNPIDILQAFHEQSPNALKFGGDLKSIVIADFYEIPNCVQYPVLIVADTKMVPTRYYLHAMHFFINWHENGKHIGEYLQSELADVGNKVIKAGSLLVLGPNLQNWINPEMYTKGNHNLKLVVPFDQLEELDKIDRTLGIRQNFNEILKEAVSICDSVGPVFELDVSKSTNEEVLRQHLQIYLAIAISLRFFSGTPLRSLANHLIDQLSWDNFTS